MDCYVECNWSEDDARVKSKSVKPQWKGILISSLVTPETVFTPNLAILCRPAPAQRLAIENGATDDTPNNQLNIQQSLHLAKSKKPPIQICVRSGAMEIDDEPASAPAEPSLAIVDVPASSSQGTAPSQTVKTRLTQKRTVAELNWDDCDVAPKRPQSSNASTRPSDVSAGAAAPKNNKK